MCFSLLLSLLNSNLLSIVYLTAVHEKQTQLNLSEVGALQQKHNLLNQ